MSRYQLDHRSCRNRRPVRTSQITILDIKTGWRADGMSGILPAHAIAQGRADGASAPCALQIYEALRHERCAHVQRNARINGARDDAAALMAAASV
jgi:hypothetical protein